MSKETTKPTSNSRVNPFAKKSLAVTSVESGPVQPIIEEKVIPQ